MSSKVEKIKFLDRVDPLSAEVFSCVADTYARQDIHINTLREVAEKIRKIKILYSLPSTVTCDEDEIPVMHIDLTGQNLQTILSLNELEEGD